MTPSGQSICLCMIVKNEAHVIRRCLDSVRPLIDHWLIVDTGSTDGTQTIVREHVRDIPGELVERPWQDFAHNRSEALALARSLADYSLIIDADDAFAVPPGFEVPNLDADSYVVDIRDSNIAYQRTQLVRNTLPWRYAGVLHEYIVCDGAKTTGHLPVTMLRNHDGARRRDPETYRKDAALLERALSTETDPFLVSRYTFYLAQSYRDCGAREQAVQRYLERAGLGYWDQEIFVSLYQAAKLMEVLGRPRDEILRTYARATAACPSRIEARHGAARLCRLSDDFVEAAALAEPALGREAPAGGLFVESWIYAYGLDDEFSVSTYWIGRHRESAEAAARVLASPALPKTERPRVLRNQEFALEQIAKQTGDRSPPPAAGWVPSRPQGGTELMVEGLRARLGAALDAIDLRVNLYDPATRDARPLVVWFHHDIDQAAVQWCRDPALTDPVACFVFVSHWQRERYVASFGLRPERCVVIRNAIEPSAQQRSWVPAPVYRCAYTSTPFRGLDVLLDAWERLPLERAELHIWSSMKLYAGDDTPYRALLDRARSMQGVVYHGLAPNAELRTALRSMHFLTYPSTFAETACLSVMEAIEAGCRVIVPALGALPETTGGYARLYPWCPEPDRHAEIFAETLAQEFADPWEGRPDDSLLQQAHAATIFAWERRLGEWRRLIAALGVERRSTPIELHGTTPSSPAQLHGTPIQTPKFRPVVKRIETRKGSFFVTEQDYVSKQIEAAGDWEPHLFDFAEMVLKNDSNVLDLGANIGFHSISLSRLIPDGTLFAFEPLNLCFSQLQMNVITNKIHNVQAFKMAATDRSGEPIEMEALDATKYGNDIVNIGNTRIGQGGDFAFSVRLDDMKFPKIDLVKIDVQGSELIALRGMDNLIARDRPVLFVEVEEYHLRKSGTSSKELIQFFLRRNYNLIRVKTEWPADHIAIPSEKVDLEKRCRSYHKFDTEWISGSDIELEFDNDFLYSRYIIKHDKNTL